MAEIEDPRHCLVTDGKETNPDYKVGTIQLLGVSSFASVVCIAEVEGQLLVCLPNSVWGKRKTDRSLPGNSFKKSISVEVSAVPSFDREAVVEETSLKVWIGLLAPESEKHINFSGDVIVDKSFDSDGLLDAVPYAGSLVAIAAEHFAFMSAEEGLVEDPLLAGGLEQRVADMETALSGIQAALDSLVAQGGGRARGGTRTAAQKQPQPGVAAEGGSARAGATPKRTAKPPDVFEGLDKTVVDAALQAGVAESHLAEMAQVIRGHPKRMEDIPRPAGTPARRGELSESEDSSEEDGEAEGEAVGLGDGGVAKAIVKLTKVCSVLAEGKIKKKSEIEMLLDQSNLGGSSDGSGLGAGRKNAQALRALKRCLVENPSYIYKAIESNLLTDFSARPSRPGDPMGQATARGWLESRSRILNYTNHVRWSWGVAGIWDDLIRGDVGSARARSALLIAASDQAAIDSGSWLLSNISLLEPVPPFQSFAAHQPPSPQEMQHSALWDPRWFELFLSHVKDLDSYQESRKKLARPSGAGRGGSEEVVRAPKPKVKPKQKPPKQDRESAEGSAN